MDLSRQIKKAPRASPKRFFVFSCESDGIGKHIRVAFGRSMELALRPCGFKSRLSHKSPWKAISTPPWYLINPKYPRRIYD